ncbi:MAG: ATP-binding protein [Thermoflexales bacterium]|nr:ATP-binding protein [Thermoflexales bacterium]
MDKDRLTHEDGEPAANTESTVEFIAPATFAAVRVIDSAVSNLLIRAGADEFNVYNVQLAAHEICTNIVRHAYAGRDDGTIAVLLRISHTPRLVIQIELRDQGRPFDSQSAAVPDFDQPQEGGYGLFLARALLDELHYRCDERGNLWQLLKRL